MTPADTIRNVIGHEVAHYVSFKMDLVTIGIEETIKKFKSSLKENGDGGYNDQFENICKTLGVDEGFSGEYYTRSKKEKMLLVIKKFLLVRVTSLVCDDEYKKYVKRNISGKKPK